MGLGVGSAGCMCTLAVVMLFLFGADRRRRMLADSRESYVHADINIQIYCFGGNRWEQTQICLIIGRYADAGRLLPARVPNCDRESAQRDEESGCCGRSLYGPRML